MTREGRATWRDHQVQVARAAGFQVLPPSHMSLRVSAFWAAIPYRARCATCGHVLHLGQRTWMQRHAEQAHGMVSRLGRSPVPVFGDYAPLCNVSVPAGSRAADWRAHPIICLCGHVGDAGDPHRATCHASPLRAPYMVQRAAGARAIDAWRDTIRPGA